MDKERIDVLLTVKGLAPSREKARIFVLAGEVFVGGERIDKPDRKFPVDTVVHLRQNIIPFVSYGGVKLDSALNALGLDVSGKTIVDIGASTGGFTDCLLQRGATKIYAVDVGSHQLHERIHGDPRVVILDKINARYLERSHIGERVQMVTIDVSFISLRKILPVVPDILEPGGVIVSLVKPQFEVGRYDVGKGGIVKNQDKIDSVIEELKQFGSELGLEWRATAEAPRELERKNREYFLLWER